MIDRKCLLVKDLLEITRTNIGLKTPCSTKPFDKSSTHRDTITAMVTSFCLQRFLGEKNLTIVLALFFFCIGLFSTAIHSHASHQQNQSCQTCSLQQQLQAEQTPMQFIPAPRFLRLDLITSKNTSSIDLTLNPNHPSQAPPSLTLQFMFS